jgi:protein-tyrosine phosphatase
MGFCEGEKDVSEILPGVWLGNSSSALDIDFLTKFKITYIINVTKDVPNKYNHIKYLHIPIDDIDACSINLIRLFDKATEFIMSVLSKNEKILVHCKKGHHRSASVVAAFMMRYLKIDYLSAITYINNVRNCAMVRNTCMMNGLFKYYVHTLTNRDKCVCPTCCNHDIVLL